MSSLKPDGLKTLFLGSGILGESDEYCGLPSRKNAHGENVMHAALQKIAHGESIMQTTSFR